MIGPNEEKEVDEMKQVRHLLVLALSALTLSFVNSRKNQDGKETVFDAEALYLVNILVRRGTEIAAQNGSFVLIECG